MSTRTIRLVVDSESQRFAQEVTALADPARFEVLSYVGEGHAGLRRLMPIADVAYIYHDRLDGDMIRSAPNLRLIQKHGLNCKNIDVSVARERGVPVATLPLFRNAAVAEQAFALMIACARKIVPGHKAVEEGVYRTFGLDPILTAQREHRGNWARIEGIMELKGATVGIIGMGDIGMELSRRCRAFDMDIVYHQREPHPPEVEASFGARHLSLNELLGTADYVVLIIPHTPETEGLIGRDQIALMKPSATLVNVARGGVVDEDALVRALIDRKIAMAGLDVFRYEPLPVTSQLIGLPNVVMTPHTGGGSYRSRKVDREAGLANIIAFIDKEKPGGPAF